MSGKNKVAWYNVYAVDSDNCRMPVATFIAKTPKDAEKEAKTQWQEIMAHPDRKRTEVGGLNVMSDMPIMVWEPDPDHTPRTISEVARDIWQDWKKVYFGAVPYLQAMMSLDKVNEQYGLDDARGIVLYFLSNAHTYRGPRAKQLKLELEWILQRPK